MSNIKIAGLVFAMLPFLALGCQGCRSKNVPLGQGTHGFTMKSAKINGKLQPLGVIIVPPESTADFVVELNAPKGARKVITGVVNLLQNEKSGGVASLQSGTVRYRDLGKDVYEASFTLDVPKYSGEALIQLRDVQKSIAEIPCRSATNVD